MKLFNTRKFTCWRLEEKALANRYLKGVRSNYAGKSIRSVKVKLNEGYLLRDVCIAMLDKHNGRYNADDILLLEKGLQSIIGVEIDLYNVVRSSMELWSRNEGYHSVQSYLTPKSILYTLRGDYDEILPVTPWNELGGKKNAL